MQELDTNHTNMNNQILQAERPQSPHLSQSNFNVIWNQYSRETKKLYHQCIDKLVKVQKAKATLWFLNQCVSRRLIPKSFLVKSTPDQRFSKESKVKWENNLKTIMFNNLKLAANEQALFETKCVSEFESSKSLVILSIPVDHHDIVLDQITSRSQALYCKESNNKKMKLSRLSQGHPTPKPVQPPAADPLLLLLRVIPTLLLPRPPPKYHPVVGKHEGLSNDLDTGIKLENSRVVNPTNYLSTTVHTHYLRPKNRC